MIEKCGGGVIVAQQTFQFAGGGSKPTSPHQLQIKEINPKIAILLNKMWHSTLPKILLTNIVRNTHYVCYGIFFKNKALGVAIWSSPVAQNRLKDGKKILELRRLALNDSCPKNTASRAISIMTKLIKKKFPEIRKLISYQDVLVHKGTIYKASNWKIEAYSYLVSWSSTGRKRNKEQSTGKKVRWSFDIRHNSFQKEKNSKLEIFGGK